MDDHVLPNVSGDPLGGDNFRKTQLHTEEVRGAVVWCRELEPQGAVSTHSVSLSMWM